MVRVLQHAGMLDDERIHLITFSAAAVVREAPRAWSTVSTCLRTLGQPHHAHPASRPGWGCRCGRRSSGRTSSASGLPTYMWTVNEPEDMLWSRDNGVDLMATDEVSLALEVLGG